MSARPIVVLGMMTKMPVGGVVWQTLHYLLGLQRLGFEVFYVEAHARTPTSLMRSEHDDGSALAGAFLDRVLRPHGLGDRWAFLALHDDGRCLGLSRTRLDALYASAELIINLHGGTEPLPEMARTGRLVYIETDPVQLQLELHGGYQYAIDFLEPHAAFFTFGENIGRKGCGLPAPERFAFHPTRQPVLLDLWPAQDDDTGTYTTVGNWAQAWREVTFEGTTYSWSKHREWVKVLDLPERTGRRFELALSSYLDSDRELLERHGWVVRHALDVSSELDGYRAYVASSRGELTVAKEQNVHFRTGWFSDRSATYLACGRPVVTQETGFSDVLPTGRGLFGFDDLDGAAAAVESIEADYRGHRRAAADLAREAFSADVVLRDLLGHVGVELAGRRGRPPRRPPALLPDDTPLEPVSRRPMVLAPALEDAGAAPLASHPVRVDARFRPASIVIVTWEGRTFTRLTLDSVLAHTEYPNYEVVVVDNGSTDGTVELLREVAASHPNVRVVENAENRGFPAAANQGLRASRGDVLVLLNSDVLVAPGWLSRLVAHLDERGDALVGPVTNRIGNEAEVPVPYTTWGGFLAHAAERAARHDGVAVPIHTLTMFCLALPRRVMQRLGELDERFGVGTLEDDDFSMRARRAGLPLLCAEDVLVHHFGEASFGRLVPSGERDAILDGNRRRFADKWGEAWRSYGRRRDEGYELAIERARQAIAAHVPPGATVAVVSKGDERLVDLGERTGRHFPQGDGGVWAGHHPADSAEALAGLAQARREGASHLVVPSPSLWWLAHYTELAERLAGGTVHGGDDCVIFDLRAVLPA